MAQYELIMNHLNGLSILSDNQLELALNGNLTTEEKQLIASKIVDLIPLALVSDSDVMRTFLTQNQQYIPIDNLKFDRAKVIMSYLLKNQIAEPNLNVFTKLAIKDAITHKNYALINNLLSINRNFEIDKELLLLAQQYKYEGFSSYNTSRPLRWHKTDPGSSPKVSDEEWDYAEQLFNKLKQNYEDNQQQEFCIKISRKTDIGLKRSFICQRILLTDGKYRDNLYALSRGAIDLTTVDPASEGILGFGANAVVKIAVTRDGEKKAYRVSNEKDARDPSDNAELRSITGATPVIQPSQTNATPKPWILKRSDDFYKSRELHPFHEGVTLKEYLSDNTPLSKDDCLHIIKTIQQDLQQRFHHKNWAHKDIHTGNVILNINAGNQVDKALFIDSDSSIKLVDGTAEKFDTPRFIMLVEDIINASELNGTNVSKYITSQVKLVFSLMDESDVNKYQDVPTMEDFIAKINELVNSPTLKY